LRGKDSHRGKTRLEEYPDLMKAVFIADAHLKDSRDLNYRKLLRFLSLLIHPSSVDNLLDLKTMACPVGRHRGITLLPKKYSSTACLAPGQVGKP